jgi:rubrerythrin
MVDPVGWARALAKHLTWHMDTEREVLREYGRFAEEVTDERLRYLINLVLDDEVRHHRVFSELVNWLRAETETREVPGPRVPDDMPTHEDREAILAKTKHLLEVEHEDAQELKALRRDIDKIEDTAWWTILIEAMELDTRKHIKILEYIRDQVK